MRPFSWKRRYTALASWFLKRSITMKSIRTPSLRHRWPQGVPGRLLLIGVRHLEYCRLTPRTPGDLHANGQVVRAEPAGDRERRRIGQIKRARQEKGQSRGCCLTGDGWVVLDRLGRLARGGRDQHIVGSQG